MDHKNEQPFKPTLAMTFYWMAYADPYTKPTRIDVAVKATELMKENDVIEKDIPTAESIRRMTYEWENEEKYPGYREWRDQFWDKLMRDSKSMLDKIGMQKGVQDFRYWEVMQMKYANYKRKMDMTTDDKPINNTDQIANLLTEVLKNNGGESDSNKDSKEGDNTKTGSKEGAVPNNTNS